MSVPQTKVSDVEMRNGIEFVPLASVDAVLFASPAKPQADTARSIRIRFIDGSRFTTRSIRLASIVASLWLEPVIVRASVTSRSPEGVNE